MNPGSGKKTGRNKWYVAIPILAMALLLLFKIIRPGSEKEVHKPEKPRQEQADQKEGQDTADHLPKKPRRPMHPPATIRSGISGLTAG